MEVGSCAAMLIGFVGLIASLGLIGLGVHLWNKPTPPRPPEEPDEPHSVISIMRDEARRLGIRPMRVLLSISGATCTAVLVIGLSNVTVKPCGEGDVTLRNMPKPIKNVAIASGLPIDECGCGK